MSSTHDVDYIPIQIDVSAEPSFDPPLLGVTVLAEGTLAFVNAKGDTVTLTLPASADAGGSYPFTLWGRIQQILDETTLEDAEIVGHGKPPITRNLAQ